MTEEKQQDEAKTEPKKSVLEETKEAIAEIKKEREELSKIRDELNQLRSEQLLSGTGGANVKPEPPKPLTPKEYAEILSKGIVPRDN